MSKWHGFFYLQKNAHYTYNVLIYNHRKEINKSELVIELLKGEKDLNTIATENNIQPNLLRNWKKEFLDKTSVVFDDTREDNLKEKLALERKEKAENAKKSRPAIRRIKVWEL